MTDLHLCQAAKQAVLWDTSDPRVQAIIWPDSQPVSPSPKALTFAGSTDSLGGVSGVSPHVTEKDNENTSSSSESEGAEEESSTDDEMVEPVERHERCTYVIDSDEETLLSPQKPKPASSEQEHSGEPEDRNAGCSRSLPSEPLALDLRVKIEEVMDSDEENTKSTSKGVFKDWKKALSINVRTCCSFKLTCTANSLIDLCPKNVAL